MPFSESVACIVPVLGNVHSSLWGHFANGLGLLQKSVFNFYVLSSVCIHERNCIIKIVCVCVTVMCQHLRQLCDDRMIVLSISACNFTLFYSCSLEPLGWGIQSKMIFLKEQAPRDSIRPGSVPRSPLGLWAHFICLGCRSPSVRLAFAHMGCFPSLSCLS